MAKDPKAEVEKASKKLADFLKKNKLKRETDYSKDKKFGKEFKELTLNLDKAKEALTPKKVKSEKVEKAPSDTKAKKAKSDKGEKGSGAGRTTKYDYPAGLTPKEKKQFRIDARKAENGGKKSEKASKAKVEKTVEKTKKVSTKDKSTKDKGSKKKKKGNKGKGND